MPVRRHISTSVSPPAFLQALEVYARDWRESRLPPALLADRIYELRFARTGPDAFRLAVSVSQGQQGFDVEGRGTVRADQDGTIIAIEVGLEGGYHERIWLPASGVAALIAVLGAWGQRPLASIVGWAVVLGLAVAAGTALNGSAAVNRLAPGLEAVLRRVARQEEGQPLPAADRSRPHAG